MKPNKFYPKHLPDVSNNYAKLRKGYTKNPDLTNTVEDARSLTTTSTFFIDGRNNRRIDKVNHTLDLEILSNRIDPIPTSTTEEPTTIFTAETTDTTETSTTEEILSTTTDLPDMETTTELTDPRGEIYDKHTEIITVQNCTISNGSVINETIIRTIETSNSTIVGLNDTIVGLNDTIVGLNNTVVNLTQSKNANDSPILSKDILDQESNMTSKDNDVIERIQVHTIPPEIEAILNQTKIIKSHDYDDYDYNEPSLPPSLPNLK